VLDLRFSVIVLPSQLRAPCRAKSLVGRQPFPGVHRGAVRWAKVETKGPVVRPM
jgi:hypothetical protein